MGTNSRTKGQIMATSRAPCTFFALLLCGLLLFTSHDLTGQGSKDSKHVINRQPVLGDEPVTLLSPRQERTIAVPFGYELLLVNYSALQSQRTHFKRAGLNFEQARKKGNDFYTAYQTAIDCGNPPGTIFTEAQFRNAWADEPGEEDELETYWQTAFQTNIGNVPSDILALDALQNKAPFISAAGQQATVPTGAFYKLQFIPSANAIIALDTESPDYRLARRGIPKPARNAAIPALNRLSDMMWYVWDSISEDPGKLRYIGRDTITNSATEGIMDEILQKTAGNARAPWPGKTFGLDTDEGKALLGTPNGVAVGWLLIDRYREMGKREPRVTIWVVGNSRIMLWDLKPV
ncbi:MAG: hypothetical protein Q9205_005420 [Flavoplaca limonia]